MAERSRSTAEFFAAVSKELLEQPDEPLTFQRVVDRAVTVIPAVDHCSAILRRARGRFETIASSSETAQRADDLQHHFGEGPCLSAAAEEDSFVVQDTGADKRWPKWGPAASELGINSMMGVQLSREDGAFGALNLFSERSHAFDPENIDTAMIYAAHAAGAVHAAHLVTGLQTAMHSRHLIGVAQGRLMERYGVSLETSFEVLRRYSSHANAKLRDVAQHVVAEGDLPEDYAELLDRSDH